jgi:perosamine synthetase
MTADVCTGYEQAFADFIGTRQAFSFWKGRVALYAILKGMGIRPGDDVILPGYTCVMAVNPIVYLGARPVFVDIDPTTYNIDPDLIAAKITPRTRLIIAQHTYGYPADLDAILDVAGRAGLPIIEDCCLALGSRYKGRLVGTFGLASYFSFQWNKPYTSGLGGMAAVQDANLANKIADICKAEAVTPGAREVNMLRAQLAVYRSLIYPRTTAVAQNAFRLLTRLGLVVGSSSPSELYPRMDADFFKRMSPLQARAGLRQLRRRDASMAHRRRLTKVYDELLAACGWPASKPPPDTDPVLVRYPVRVADKPRALASAARHFVELGSWFECPLHPIETPLEAYGYHTGLCPQSERACRETVNLPVHPRANKATARRSVDFVAAIGRP